MQKILCCFEDAHRPACVSFCQVVDPSFLINQSSSSHEDDNKRPTQTNATPVAINYYFIYLLSAMIC